MKLLTISLIASAAILAGCAAPQSSAEIDDMKQQLATVMKTRQAEQGNLANFDDLDFNVYSGQKWELLGKSHSKDIVVHYPDSHTSKGLEAHVEELKPMFVFAPDTRITEHPIRIASGDWTAVSGTTSGTFTLPMPIGGGKFIPPTGKSFKLGMITIGHWRDGVMDEEWLMWDNLSFMKQIGLAP
jgi:predicted ester cyclase